MLIVYGTPRTRASRITWMLEEIGASYDYRPVALDKGEGRQPPYLALNPTGKVPTLVDGDLVLGESAAIVTYLGDKYTLSNLVPRTGGAARAKYNQWCYFCLSELEQPLWTRAKHTFALPENKRVAAIKDTALWEFAQAAKVLAQQLDRTDYVLGAEFSAADILIGHTLSWARGAKIELGQDSLQAYADRVLSRPALAQAYQREQQAITA
ncbi:MAG: glutathione S-transferase family protein [Gammaproteobacteria bacterium]